MGTSKKKVGVIQYKVYITPSAWQEIKDLPGHIKQRVKQGIEELTEHPRPSSSKQLEVPELKIELRRLRLDKWRIVYAITEENKLVDVLAVRKRPPYDYGDLGTLLGDLSS